jgi:threonine synthase
LARLIDFYGGHMFDERDPVTKKVIKEGVIDSKPNLEEMRANIFSISINNAAHYSTMKRVYDSTKIILDPHGAVGWKSLEEYRAKNKNSVAVIYETADPGKFPLDVNKAIGVTPPLPDGMNKQKLLTERVYSINSAPLSTPNGLKLTDAQIKEAKDKISALFA